MPLPLRSLYFADTPPLPRLSPGLVLVGRGQTAAQHEATRALLAGIARAEGEVAWWLYCDVVVCPRWRVVVEIAVN